MTGIQELIVDHFDLWTSAKEKKSTSGRGSGSKISLHGLRRLRELTLELAVQGRLVPQDPNDRPAKKLLRDIAAERSARFNEGNIRGKWQPAAIIAKPDIELPSNWLWVPVAQIIDSHLGGGTPSKNNADYWNGNIPWASVKDVGKTKYLHNTEDRITSEGLENSSSNLIPEDWLLVVTRMGLGKLSINKVPVAINQDIRALSVSSRMNLEYCYLVFQTLKIEGAGLTVKGVKVGKLLATPFPLPPLEEQHRIVSKVDELMSLCDELERQTEDSRAAHQTLVETLLGTLTNSKSAEELSQNWARFADHFNTLFTTEESIGLLKQTILELAVMGRLTEQDPKDEPASKLLERIKLELVKLSTEGKTKRQKPLPPLEANTFPFDIPNTWAWVRFEDVVAIHSGITKGRKITGRKTEIVPYLRVANVQRGYLDLEAIKTIEIPSDEVEKYRVSKGDLLIAEGGDWDKVGRAAIWCDEVPYMAHQNHIFKARKILREQSEEWFELFLNSKVARVYFAGASKQTTNLASINKTQLRGCLVPIPPLSEQHRIVAKVDELMTLCEFLVARLRDSQTTRLRLADAVLTQALAKG